MAAGEVEELRASLHEKAEIQNHPIFKDKLCIRFKRFGAKDG